MKICTTAAHIQQRDNYFSITTNCVEIRVLFLTDFIVRIRAGFDGDFAEESYSLVMTAWEDRMDDFMKKSSIIAYSRDALEAVHEEIEQFAEAEGLTAHANSVRVRFS